MTHNTSIEALGRNPEHLVELDEEPLRNTHLVESHEASYRPWRAPSMAGNGAHGTLTLQQTGAQLEPGKIDELNRDMFLRFRDGWVRKRAQEIQRAGSISFKTCSEDTASITALNEFYRLRIFEGFKAESREEDEIEIGMLQASCETGSFPKDVPAPKRFQMCRIVCREKGRRVLNTTCPRRAKSRL